MRLRHDPAVRRAASVLAAGLLASAVVPAAQADLVLDWNMAGLNAIRAERTNPPKGSRALAIAHLAIFDALNGIERSHRPYLVQVRAPAGASLEAAVAAAGFTALNALFTNANVRATNLQALYETQLAAVPDGQAKSDGLAWGQSVAEALLAARAADGSTDVVGYTPSGKPGYWKPTPPANAAALLPSWAHLKPFTMTAAWQFRPQAPPPITGAAYSFEYNTVKNYGGAVSALRTANQSETARFWDDGPGTVTPPGHWNLIAQEVSRARQLTVAENARLFALLNLGTADAAICAWDAKYAHDYWRPITAIPEGDTDGNPETEPDPTWTSFINTPPFPEYTSGHSTFSRASATILAGFFGQDDIPFTSVTDGLPGVARSYAGFSVAADEAGISRIYGGIHWPSANLHGQAGGYRIGHQVLTYYLQPLTALEFSHLAFASEGGVDLELRGEANRPYQVRASSDLKTWEIIGTYSSTDGLIRFRDVHAVNHQLRFYQAVAE